MNVAIAGIGSVLLTVASTGFGIVAFVILLVIIYLRGYLVPGTPYLTQRYLPDQILRWFEKEPVPTPTSKATTIDPEQVLLDAHAVTLCENDTDLCLTNDFHSAWREQVRILRKRGDPNENDLRDALDAHSGRISFEAYGTAFLASTDNNVIGQWPSPAALTVDVAAANTLAEWHPDWTAMSPSERARVLASLRIFVETCPQCGSSVRVKQDSVESCCRSYDVLLSACQECDEALFEIEWTEELSSIELNNQSRQSSSTKM